ncbi:MAG: LacI family DNA-binding transcriptional regulator, partial [Brevinematia bacterium]
FFICLGLKIIVFIFKPPKNFSIYYTNHLYYRQVNEIFLDFFSKTCYDIPMKIENKVKIRDIAKIAGVSPMTVSRALNNKPDISEETKRKILKIVKELKYYPNIFGRGLVKQKSHIIGIIGPSQGITYDNPYFAGIMRGIEAVCIEKSYDFLIKIYSHDYEKLDYLKLYYESKVDGVILIAPDINHPELKEIIEKKLPYIIVGTKVDNMNISYIDSENKESMLKGVEEIVKKGHKKIAFIKGPENQTDAIERYQGFLLAMKKYKIEINKNWIFSGNFLYESGIEACRKILKLKDKPTAVVCANDLMAFGFINEAIKSGYKIPEDFSVIGFDCVPWVKFSHPLLSTIKQPLEEMGKKAAELLFEKMEKSEFKERAVVFPCNIEKGETISKPRT